MNRKISRDEPVVFANGRGWIPAIYNDSEAYRRAVLRAQGIDPDSCAVVPLQRVTP